MGMYNRHPVRPFGMGKMVVVAPHVPEQSSIPPQSPYHFPAVDVGIIHTPQPASTASRRCRFKKRCRATSAHNPSMTVMG